MQVVVSTPQQIDEVIIDMIDCPVVIPPKKNLYRMKRDQDMYAWNFKVRQSAIDLGSAPAVNRTGEITNPADFRRSTFTKEWQFFWADLLAMYRYGKPFNSLGGTERDHIVRTFNSLTLSDKYLTNFLGTDNCNNYITGKMRDQDPKIDPLVCAESDVEVMEIRTSTEGKTSSLQMARLHTFMENETPPAVTKELLNDPRVLWATVIYPDGQLIPFPNFDGDPVPYPYIAKQECWFYLQDMEKVA